MHDTPHSPAEEAEAHGHDASLAHHFESHRQQFDAGKLGLWLFLITELLFFSGMFCAYAVYRATYPEVFRDAARYLDTNLGALNTVVLIFSSLTMAWAVRSAQLNQRRRLIACLSITLACAFVFLGVKYVEYKAKWEHGLLWSGFFDPKDDGHHGGDGHGQDDEQVKAGPAETAPTDPAAAQAAQRDEALRKQRLGTFFAVYFGMTGLHGLHVIAGIVVIAWILWRAVRGDFNSEFFGPVDGTGLYWHFVDLVWIYLFPLLYLIH